MQQGGWARQVRGEMLGIVAEVAREAATEATRVAT